MTQVIIKYRPLDSADLTRRTTVIDNVTKSLHNSFKYTVWYTDCDGHYCESTFPYEGIQSINEVRIEN